MARICHPVGQPKTVNTADLAPAKALSKAAPVDCSALPNLLSDKLMTVSFKSASICANAGNTDCAK